MTTLSNMWMELLVMAGQVLTLLLWPLLKKRTLQLSGVKAVLQQMAKKIFYVYTIRAMANFYDCVESLKEAMRVTGDQSYQALIDKYSCQEEWSVFNGAIFSQVQKVDIYEVVNNQFVLTGTKNNAKYIDANTEGNPDPFPISGSAPRTHWLLPISVPNLTACFGLCIYESSLLQANSAQSCPLPYEAPI